MRVLMFGWEFPPDISGGLGVACEGLVRGLLDLETDVALVLPHRPLESGIARLRILSPPRGASRGRPKRGRNALLRIRRIPSLLKPYLTQALYAEDRREAGRAGTTRAGNYGPDLPGEVLRYSEAAARIASRESFDVIHAHDWLTFLAGMEAKRATGKPLVLHVHATEFDRTGNGDNTFVTSIERLGFSAADRVVTVSSYTAQVVATRYGVPADRLRVVHNAIDACESDGSGSWRVEQGDPLVLFAGRITWQKGPEYFVDAAARVAAERPDVKFAVAGAGDRMLSMRERVAALGLQDRFLFTGFLPPGELDRLYARADLYVMPSVSEPFGLAALEALQHGTPVIVSRSAGVAEVVRNVLRVDFGDVEDLASKILAVLMFPPLRDALSARGRAEVRRLSWRDSAERCLAVYRELVRE